MKFNVTFVVAGPLGRTVSVPCSGNPVECANLAGLLADLAGNLPYNPHLGVETVGVRVERVPEPTPPG